MAPTPIRKALVSALLVLALAAVVSGCGRRGRLEPPPDPNKPAVEEPASKTGLKRRPKNPPIKAPNEPFILDPLLQ